MSRRRATVFDAAALRIHRDGTRTTENNKRKRVIDAYGNPIAVDAVGKLPGTKKKPRPKGDKGKGKQTDNDEEDELELIELEDTLQEENSLVSTSRSKRKRADGATKEHKHRDTIKRARFDNQFEFLSNAKDTTVLGHGVPSGSEPPLPESDFLKTIHYLASHYYDSRNLLPDLAHEQRAQKRQQEQEEDKKQRDASYSSQDSGYERDEEQSGSKSAGTKPSTNRPKKYRQAWQTDMYRAFTGDMLVAFGIVLQEDVIFQLRKKNPPDGWEEMVEASQEYHEDWDGGDHIRLFADEPSSNISDGYEVDDEGETDFGLSGESPEGSQTPGLQEDMTDSRI